MNDIGMAADILRARLCALNDSLVTGPAAPVMDQVLELLPAAAGADFPEEERDSLCETLHPGMVQEGRRAPAGGKRWTSRYLSVHILELFLRDEVSYDYYVGPDIESGLVEWWAEQGRRELAPGEYRAFIAILAFFLENKVLPEYEEYRPFGFYDEQIEDLQRCLAGLKGIAGGLAGGPSLRD